MAINDFAFFQRNGETITFIERVCTSILVLLDNAKKGSIFRWQRFLLKTQPSILKAFGIQITDSLQPWTEIVNLI